MLNLVPSVDLLLLFRKKGTHLNLPAGFGLGRRDALSYPLVKRGWLHFREAQKTGKGRGRSCRDPLNCTARASDQARYMDQSCASIEPPKPRIIKARYMMKGALIQFW